MNRPNTNSSNPKPFGKQTFVNPKPTIIMRQKTQPNQKTTLGLCEIIIFIFKQQHTLLNVN